MPKLFDLVKVNIATTGTGTVTFGSVFSPEFFTPSEVSAVDGDTVRYVLIDGTDIELGVGTIGGSVTTMTRTVTRSRVSGVAGTSLLNLSGSAHLALTAAAADILNPADPATLRTALSLRGYLSGLTLSTAGSSATFGIAAGIATDSTNADMMVLASAYTKTTSSWAVGTGNGALDTGSIANSTWYHVFLIKRTDTGVVDVLLSTSATSPTLPTNYTISRRIGSMKTNGSAQWTKFSQNGDEFLWDVRVTDLSGATTSPTASSVALTVPSGVKVNALLTMRLDYVSAATSTLVSSLDESDQSPSTFCQSGTVTATATLEAAALNVRTDTSRQIRTRSAGGAGTGATLGLSTYGWADRRGRDD